MTLRNVLQLVMGLGIVVTACGSKPSAMDVCVKLEGAGVAANCREGAKSGVAQAAKEVVEYDVPGLAGEGGVVMSFETSKTYDSTMRSYMELGSLNGKHRFGRKEKLVFTAINEQASEEAAAKAASVFEAL